MARESARLEGVIRLTTYNQRVFDAFLRGLERRGWKAAAAERGIAHGSFKNTMVHILNVHEAWMVAITQRRWEIFSDPSRRATNIRSFAELRRYRSRVWKEVDRLLSGLTDMKLRRRVKAPWMPGRYTLEDAFFQVTFEEAHHLG
jgi:uncharacterized damage-inducible protein DinB